MCLIFWLVFDFWVVFAFWVVFDFFGWFASLENVVYLQPDTDSTGADPALEICTHQIIVIIIVKISKSAYDIKPH